MKRVTGVSIQIVMILFAVSGVVQGQSISIDDDSAWNAPQTATRSRTESHDGIEIPVSSARTDEEGRDDSQVPARGDSPAGVSAGTASPQAAPAPKPPVRRPPPAPPVLYPPNVNPSRDRDDLTGLKTGAARRDMEEQLGAPSARVFIPDDEGLRELHIFSGKSGYLGTVEVTEGAVSAVKVKE